MHDVDDSSGSNNAKCDSPTVGRGAVEFVGVERGCVMNARRWTGTIWGPKPTDINSFQSFNLCIDSILVYSSKCGESTCFPAYIG